LLWQANVVCKIILIKQLPTRGYFVLAKSPLQEDYKKGNNEKKQNRNIKKKKKTVEKKEMKPTFFFNFFFYRLSRLHQR